MVRLSPFDNDHARHTSFALAEVMPKVEQGIDIEINSDDLRVDVFRAGGHGGQNVQKKFDSCANNTYSLWYGGCMPE